MTFRSLLNAAYSYLARNAVANDGQEALDRLDAELEAEPRVRPAGRPEARGRSRNVGKLLAAMGGPLGTPPPRPKGAN